MPYCLYRSAVLMCVKWAGLLRTARILAACQARSFVAVSVVRPTSARPEATVAHTVAFQMCKRAFGPAVRLLWTYFRTFCNLTFPLLKPVLQSGLLEVAV